MIEFSPGKQKQKQKQKHLKKTIANDDIQFPSRKNFSDIIDGLKGTCLTIDILSLTTCQY